MKILKTMFLVASGLSLWGNQASAAVVLSKVNSTSGLFDGSSGTRAFNFTLPESGGTITDVNISIQFGKHDGETFGVNGGGTPFYNEIVFRLIGNVVGPDPTANLISSNSFNSGAGGFLNRTITFDESAGAVVNVDANNPAAGTFRSVGEAGGLGLTQFNGLTLAAGDWTLFIQDTVGFDALDFHSATLDITVDSSGTGVPTPDLGGTFWLLSLALAGIGAFRRLVTRVSTSA